MNEAAIRRTLAHRAGESPTAGLVAKAAIGTWHDVALRLAPVIGAQGVYVLFRHALYVTAKSFPWLAMATNEGSNTDLLAMLQARLAASEAEAAIEASNALLLNFAELLAGLIGESLSERLLAPIWLPVSPVPPQESTA